MFRHIGNLPQIDKGKVVTKWIFIYFHFIFDSYQSFFSQLIYQNIFDCANALERMKTKYNELKEKCRPFLQALEHFPEVAKLFTEKVKQLFSFKEAQERAEKEAREKERQERIKARRNKRGMER